MIVRYSVTNFRSYKDENILNFVSSSKISKLDYHEKIFGRLSVIKNVGIFGSNAFGKSNFLKSIGEMIKLVVTGRCDENLSFIDNKKEPTKFNIVFLMDDNKFYEYSFSIKQENVVYPYSIVDEELYLVHLSGDNELIYSKSEGLQGIDQDALRYYVDGYKNAQGQLFLKYINAPERYVDSSKVSKLLRSIYGFFAKNIIVELEENGRLFMINEKSVVATKEYLKKYDIGIEDVGFGELTPNEIQVVVSDPIFEIVINQFQNNPSIKEQYFSNLKDIYCVSLERREYKFKKLVFKHKGIKSPFCYGYESSGTKRIFSLLALLFDEENSNRTIVVDEIERSAFPGIASELLLDFQNKFKNDNTQIIFTSHLSNLIKDVLRHDEVYFVDKNAYGESRIYSLVEFKTKSKDNVVKLFGEGAYGAIPKIGVKIYDGSSD